MGLQKEEVNTQKQHDELSTHGCVHRLVEMVNVFEAMLIAYLHPQESLTALNPRLVIDIINRI